MRLIITGVPGVGKTSVANGLAKYGWEKVNFGSVMLEVAKENYGVKDRDQMRKTIKVEDYKKIQLAAAKKIAEMPGDILVDTHCSILKERWYYPGLPMGQLLTLDASGLIVIEADKKSIALRREHDKNKRDRGGEIEEHQQMNRHLAGAYGAIACIPVLFVENKQGKLEQTVETIKDSIEHL